MNQWAWILGAISFAGGTLPAKESAGPPRLAVIVSVDQCRADYLERFRPYFGDGGFARFLDHGAVFAEAHHRHASTNTSNGHATLVTGVHADVHGIIANEWLDHATLMQMTSVQDPAATLVGAAPTAVRSPGGVLGDAAGMSPRWLLATSVGDQLKLRYQDKARVISIAYKDRAAIMMGGRLGDGAYWFSRGRFVTSSYYRPALPAWVDAFNAEQRGEKVSGQEWSRLLDARIYDNVQGPDAALAEEDPGGLGATFPHRLDAGAKGVTNKYWDAYRTTPFAMTLVADFAKAAVAGEELGRHAGTDLLCIGFSQLDYCGHAYGPDSHEMMDSVIRLDRVLADLFGFLDRRVGAEKYVVVLSADHGVAPIPEHIQAFQRGLTAGRFDPATTRSAVEDALSAAFGKPEEGTYWAARDGGAFVFRPQTLQARGVSVDQAGRVGKQALLALPQIAAAYTREEVLAAPAVDDSLLSAVRRNYHRERSGDVVFVLRPYIVDRSPKGTNHGSPYDYDNHVPLLWYGPRVPVGTFTGRVGTDQVAPTLSAVLGIPRPPQCVAERLF